MKLSLFSNDIIVYVVNLKESTKGLLEPVSNYSKIAGFEVNLQKSIAFICTSKKQVDKEI